MLKITKSEAFIMRKELGETAVKKTYSKHPSYYLVESPRNMKTLDAYRKATTLEVHTA